MQLMIIQESVMIQLFTNLLLRADGMFVKADVDDPNWWLWLSEKDMAGGETKEVQDGLGSDGYVIVSQDDIVDSIASFMARYISSIPQAKVWKFSINKRLTGSQGLAFRLV